jgi:hypothetical protein
MRNYRCVHVKKGLIDVSSDTSYGAVLLAASLWKLKSTAGIDAYLLS